MKLLLAFAVATLTIAGPSLAQDQSGMAVPGPSATPIPGAFAQPGKAGDLLTARYQLRRACAADMLARCPGKDGPAADRCLEYHRVSFTLPCRKAIAAFERAAPPRTPYESLASLAPISGPIPPPGERETPAPSRTAPRNGAGD
ncbi:hypothetical protein [Phenylobacterium sp.]|uniref:hypothetical protein n=1 Tax=Phenylobacterium sp. TaxID=1871053 RepID=UPI002CAF07CF|nr:hypothetical protein [Phenylobacterium sp.]HLZ76041.1 hypothetical protein [Phenylobacterium sp.]